MPYVAQRPRRKNEDMEQRESTMTKNYSCFVPTLLSKRLPRLLGSIKLEQIRLACHCHIQNPLFLCKYSKLYLLGSWFGVSIRTHEKSPPQSYKPGAAGTGTGYFALVQKSQIFLVLSSWAHVIMRNIISGPRHI